MTRLTDGKKTIEINMQYWNETESRYTIDWSADFFEIGGLKKDEEKEAYTVKDVDYCLEQANDWKNYQGDFYDPDAQEEEKAAGKTRCVNISEI